MVVISQKLRLLLADLVVMGRGRYRGPRDRERVDSVGSVELMLNWSGIRGLVMGRVGLGGELRSGVIGIYRTGNVR